MEQLPPIPGPKLMPFQPKDNNRKFDLKFLQTIGSGADAIVLKVEISNGVYALKLFLLEPDCRLKPLISSEPYARAPSAEILHYTHPFYRECRAYGRLKEAGLEYLSVTCHGYIQLSKQQEERLKQYLKDSKVSAFDRSSKNKYTPIYGLVKDLLPESTPFESRMIPRMIKDIHDYHRYGIFVGDIREDNYRGGIIFDLSRAKTVPHPELTPDVVNKLIYFGYTDEVPHVDDEDMDTMIDNWNIKHGKEGRFIWQRMGPNYDVRRRLRTTNKIGLAARYIHPKFRPEFFDWENLRPVSKATMELVGHQWNDHWIGDSFHKGKIRTKEGAEERVAEHTEQRKRFGL